MGVKYKYRKLFYFDGLTAPSDIQRTLKPLQKEGMIFECTKPCMHYEMTIPLTGTMMFTITIAAKEQDIITVSENELIEAFEKVKCKLIKTGPIIYTFKEDGIWQRKEVE